MTASDNVRAENPGRLLLLLPTTTYRADAFMDAARRLDVPVTVASEFPSSFDNSDNPELLTLDLAHPKKAAEQVKEFTQHHTIAGVLGVDDDTTVVEAVIREALGLPANPVDAVARVRDKGSQRDVLKNAGLPVPKFQLTHVDSDPRSLLGAIPFPSVLKPVNLAASRGVIRADDEESFLKAHKTLVAIIRDECAGRDGPVDQNFLIEEYIPGTEFAVEGLMVDGTLHTLAVFEKPDPLEGPYFEETILATPPNLSESQCESLSSLVQSAATALEIHRGPVHVEVRLNEDGPALVEFHARPIGGKCSGTLRFGSDGKTSLEDILVSYALGDLTEIPRRVMTATGVMMIPIPAAGIFKDVEGVREALAVPHVDSVLITATKGRELIPLPHGSQYLGFIFAEAQSSEDVIRALRLAHQSLVFTVDGLTD